MRELSFLYPTHHHDLFYITVKYHDYIPKDILVTERTKICIKKHQRGDISKKLKRGLSFLYVTHRHDLFYITVKYHYQNIQNGFQVIEQTENRQTEARFIAISPEPFGRGIKIICFHFLYWCSVLPKLHFCAMSQKF